MKVIIYNDGEATYRLKTIFVKMGAYVSYESGTSMNLIREIKSQRPFAVIVPPEIQDAGAMLFMKRAKSELCGDEPLFFVINAPNNRRNTELLRLAGYDNVFVVGTPDSAIVRSIIEYFSFVIGMISERPIYFSKTTCKKHIRSVLKKTHFSEADVGFRYVSEAVYLLIRADKIPISKVIECVAEKYGVSKQTIYQDMRYSLKKAWETSTKRFKRTILSDYAEAPKPQEVLLYISNIVAEEISKAENNIFEPISRGNDD